MARVRPFAAWRYARHDFDITPVTAPPYDVISPDERRRLLESDSTNVVALELPDGPLDPAVPGNRYAVGAQTWNRWCSEGVLAKDPEPALYVVAQHFKFGGRTVTRRAFVAEVGLEPFSAGIVIPHEQTLPKALGDRFELIKATGANLSQVLGLFEDVSGETDDLFRTVMATPPIARATDSDGVESVLWAASDPALCARLTEFMAPRRIFIADGHHRYTTALAYAELCRAADPIAQPGDTPYDYVMMALVNMDDPDLVVLGYHRIADSFEEFDPVAFYRALSVHFDITEPLDSYPSTVLDDQERVAFLVKTRGDERPRLARLKPDIDLDSAIELGRPSPWKHLDVAVLQELVLWPILGIHPDHPETLERISFTNDAHAALAAVPSHDVAFVVRPTRLDQLKAVSLSGEMMPQKSTYFYPKLLSGLLLRDAR